MDYNVNVRLSLHSRAKSTSTRGTAERKKNSTGAGSNVRRKTNTEQTQGMTGGLGGMKKSIKGLGIVAGASQIKKAVTSTANLTADITGLVTNNRFRQQRDKDAISYLSNPIGMEISMFKYGIKEHFNVMRGNQRIEYNIRRSGNAIPTRSGNGGVTL